MFIPTEPLLFGVLLLFFIRLIANTKVDTKITNHPITYAIVFYLIWMTFTILTSEMPLVSVKFLISRMWFILPFYFLGSSFFQKYSKHQEISLALFTAIICCYFNYLL